MFFGEEEYRPCLNCNLDMMDSKGHIENYGSMSNHTGTDPLRSLDRTNMAQSESMKNEDDKEERHRYHRRHHKRHYHRMRMHDHNVRNLIDNDFDIPQACACDPVADPLMPPEALGAWGTVVQNCRVPKIKKPNLKKSGRTYGSAGSQKGTFARDRDAFQEEDNFRFQHYKDISSYIKQYREENTICIQGEDPCGPPVLGKDTPDPYFSKLSQCGWVTSDVSLDIF